MIALEAVDLTKRYKHSRQPALDGLSLEIEEGRTFTFRPEGQLSAR